MGTTVCNEEDFDQQTLIELYYSTDGANWDRQDDWLSEEDVCDWYGIMCDANDKSIEINP